MERKNQNLEFSQKLSAKSEDCLERRSSHFPLSSRPPCASGGDVAVTIESQHCNSKSSSYQNLTFRPDEDHSDTADNIEDVGQCHQMLKDYKSDHQTAADTEDSKRNYSLSTAKRKNQKYCDVGSKLKAELSKYKKELKEYNNTTKDLEEKYMKINFELTEMQQKHDRFVQNRKQANNNNENETFSDSSSDTGSEYSLKRKYTQVFHRGSSFMTMLPPQSQSSNENLPLTIKPPPNQCEIHHPRRKHKPQSGIPSEVRSRQFSPPQIHHTCHKRHSKRKHENKENEPPRDLCEPFHGRSQPAGLKDIYKVLKTVLDTNHKSQTTTNSVDLKELKELQSTISNLQNEQVQFRNIIQQQQSCLNDYHSRCVKAQQIMQTQQIEIEKLNCNNEHLESEITSSIDMLRAKIDSKLRDVAHLPQLMREEQSKYDKVVKENNLLTERLRVLQQESSQLKLKLEELARRKLMTINRLKAAERDLKIFKNYNTSLKHEKRKLNDELQKLKEQLESVQNASKRTLTRQREQNEKQRRDLQKRVFELELKLSRSQNSTTSLIQERDSLIAELQTQLNTLVHNFEVSQKHIRVLRRHIYSMSGGNVRSNSRLLNEPV